jgi:predicted enzyme related to lactoylglutathione lyase
MIPGMATPIVAKEVQMSEAHANEKEDSARGRFVWFDLLAPDEEAAKAFYPAVAGWGTQVWEAPGMSYTMWTVGEKPVGGIMKMPAEAVAGGGRPHWLAYVAVPEVDATVARAQELGATVLRPPTDIPTVGRFAVIRDPQGAEIAPFTPLPSDMKPPEGMPPVGEFSWHELATTDHEAAFAFYSELFGWEKTSSFDMGPEMGVYQLYGRGGAPLGGMYTKGPNPPGPPAWLHYARVADVNAAAEAVPGHGGQILHGPVEVPGGDWIVMVADNQGTPFAVHQVKAG